MVWTTIRLYLPIQEDEIDTLQTGDQLLLNGRIYAMRDKAIERLIHSMENRKDLPVNLKKEIIYYTGPSPALEGESKNLKPELNTQKIEPLIIRLVENFKIRATIGTGQRSDIFRDSCKNNKSLYLEAMSTIGSLMSRYVISKKITAYEDLGSEAIYQLEIKDMPLMIINDIYGRDLYELAKKEDSKNIQEILKSLANKLPDIS